MLRAEVIPPYIEQREEAIAVVLEPVQEQEYEPCVERVHPDEVPSLMAQGSLLGRIDAKEGLLITVDSASAAGITVDAPLAIDLRREIKAPKHKIKALSEDMVSLRFTEPNVPGEVDLQLAVQGCALVKVLETEVQPALKQNRPQVTGESQIPQQRTPFQSLRADTLVKDVTKPLETDDDPLPWQEQALCAQTDPETFFPEKGGSTRQAKKICVGCAVKTECLKYAMDTDERFGIWGGLSERERRTLRYRSRAR